MIANRSDGALSAEDMIQIGTQMEGHPDNVVPAIVGGMTASVYEAGQVIYSKVNVPKSLRFAIFIPDFLFQLLRQGSAPQNISGRIVYLILTGCDADRSDE